MAAGLVPIVFRDGGGWLDLASRIHPMLGYTDPEEIPSIIREIEDRGMWKELSERSYLHSMNFSYERFREELISVVSYVEEIKRLAMGSNRA